MLAASSACRSALGKAFQKAAAATSRYVLRGNAESQARLLYVKSFVLQAVVRSLEALACLETVRLWCCAALCHDEACGTTLCFHPVGVSVRQCAAINSKKYAKALHSFRQASHVVAARTPVAALSVSPAPAGVVAEELWMQTVRTRLCLEHVVNRLAGQWSVW
jgi:hypothetical protein